MQSVEKKKRGQGHASRRWLLIVLVALLAGGTGTYCLLNRTQAAVEIPDAVTYGELMAHDTGDVTRLSVTLRNGESWSVVQQTDGTLQFADDTGMAVSESMTASLLSAASVVSYDSILSEDPAEYQHALADFGLDTPRVIAEIAYADGTDVTLRIGNPSEMSDETYSYMTVDGDDRLFALDKGTADALEVGQAVLHPVTQPVIHRARIDAVTFTGADGKVEAAWRLDGSITDSDASMRWQMTAPWAYPADGEAISNLRSNLANLRFGAYVGAADEASMTAYGFDAPRFVLTIHQAAGTTGEANAEGAVVTTDWPEDTLTFTVGAAKNELVDYVLFDGSIYLTSHFSMDTFMSMQPIDTVSRYPVMVALAQLSQLTVRTAAGEDVYSLRREEQVAANNDLVTDADGNIVYDLYCTRNGADIAYDAFAAAYDQLLVVTVSGQLPTGWTPTEAPHTVYTFVTDAGLTHTIELVKFDALHDALVLDGNALFYLIDGGMTLDVA